LPEGGLQNQTAAKIVEGKSTYGKVSCWPDWMFRFRRRISSFLSIPSSVCSVGDCTDSITSGYMTKENFYVRGVVPSETSS